MRCDSRSLYADSSAAVLSTGRAQVRFDESITEAERFASHQRSWELWQHLSQEAGGAYDWGLKDDDWGRTLVQGGIPHQLRSEWVSVFFLFFFLPPFPPSPLRRRSSSVATRQMGLIRARSAALVQPAAPQRTRHRTAFASRPRCLSRYSMTAPCRKTRKATVHELDPGLS